MMLYSHLQATFEKMIRVKSIFRGCYTLNLQRQCNSWHSCTTTKTFQPESVQTIVAILKFPLSISCPSLYIPAGKKGTLSITSSGIELSFVSLAVVRELRNVLLNPSITWQYSVDYCTLSSFAARLPPLSLAFVKTITAFSQILLPISLVINDMVSFVSAYWCSSHHGDAHDQKIYHLGRNAPENLLFLVFSIEYTLRIINTNIRAIDISCFDQFCFGSNSVNVASLAHSCSPPPPSPLPTKNTARSCCSPLRLHGAIQICNCSLPLSVVITYQQSVALRSFKPGYKLPIHSMDEARLA